MKNYTLAVIAIFIGAVSYAQTITQTAVGSAKLTIDPMAGDDPVTQPANRATGWDFGQVTITCTGFPANTTIRVFNQFKVADASGGQWGGGGVDIVIDENGDGSLDWNPGFFGGAVFDGTETIGFWNTNGPGGVSVNQTFTITQETLSTKDFNKSKLNAYYNASNEMLVLDNNELKGDYTVFDITGQKVLAGKISKEISVSSLGSGIFILSTESGVLKFNK